MTRYDPHPQDYDDARTRLQASREAAGRDETASGDGQGLRGALEALAQEWERASRPRDDDDAWSHGWNVGVKNRIAELRAVLAAHPADAPEAPEPRLVPDWVRDGIEGQINAPSVFERLTQAPEAPDSAGAGSVSVVEQATRVIYQREYRMPMSSAYSQDSPGVRFAWRHAQALADAGLLADRDAERRWDDAYDRVLSERDRARARVADLEDWLRQVCDYFGYEPDDAAEVLTYLPAWRGEAAANKERVADLEAEVELERRSRQAHVTRADVAEARARRAEDALREVESLAAEWERDWEAHIVTGEHGLGYASRKGAAKRIRHALSDPGQTSDATPSDGGE